MVIAGNQVFQHRGIGEKSKVLVHEGQPISLALAQRHRQGHGPAINGKTAGIGRMKARQDLDQGRLARAVLAQQAVYFTRTDGQVRTPKGTDPAEGL